MGKISLQNADVSFEESPATLQLETKVGNLNLAGLSFSSISIAVDAKGECSLGGSTTFDISLNGLQGDIGKIAEIDMSLGTLNLDVSLTGTVGITLGLDKAAFSFSDTQATFLDQKPITLPGFSVDLSVEDLDNLWPAVKEKIESDATLIACFAETMVNLISGGLIAWHKYWTEGVVLTPAAGCDFSFDIKENIPLSIASFSVPLGATDFNSTVTGTVKLSGTGMDCSFNINALGTDHSYAYHHDLQSDLVLSKLSTAVTDQIRSNSIGVIHSALKTFGDYTNLVDKNDIAPGDLPKQFSHQLQLPTWPVAVPEIGLNLGNISLGGEFSGTLDLLHQQIQRRLANALALEKTAKSILDRKPPPPPHLETRPVDQVMPRPHHLGEPIRDRGMMQELEWKEKIKKWEKEKAKYEAERLKAEQDLSNALKEIQEIKKQPPQPQCVLLNGSLTISGGELTLTQNIKVPVATTLNGIVEFIRKNIPPQNNLLTALELASDIANKSVPLTNGVIDFSIKQFEWGLDQLLVASGTVGPFDITLNHISLFASEFKGSLSNNNGHLAVGGTFEVLGVTITLPSFDLPDEMILNHGILETVKTKMMSCIDTAWLLQDNRFLKLIQEEMVSFNNVIFSAISFDVQAEYSLSSLDGSLGSAKLLNTSFSGSFHLTGNNADGSFKALLKGSISGPPAMNPSISFDWKSNDDLESHVNSWISSDLNRFSGLWSNIGNYLHAILDGKLTGGDHGHELSDRFDFPDWAVKIIENGLSNGDAITDPKPPPPPKPPDPPDPPHPPKPHRPHHHGW